MSSKEQIIRLKCFNCKGNYMVPIIADAVRLSPTQYRNNDINDSENIDYECVRCKNRISL